MARRHCQHLKPSGERCQADPMAEADFCFWHSPDHTVEVAEAGRLGGLRRKRERTVAGAYQLAGISSVADIRRVVEIALLDTLGLDNTLGRNRTLAYLAMVALKLLEVGELEARVASLEAAVQGQPGYAESIIDAVANEDTVMFEAIVADTTTPGGEPGEAGADDMEGEA